MNFALKAGKTIDNMDEHLLRFKDDTTYVFIDCETENLCLSRTNNLPWQIAMIKVEGGKKIAEKNFHVKWERDLNVGKEAARITRFSPTKYKEKALPHEEVFPTIKDWLDNCDYIVGHNILGFDIYLIRDYYRVMREDYTHLMEKIIDTNCVARGLKLGLPYKRDESFLTYQYKILHTRKRGVRSSLKVVGKEYDIKFDENKLHEALYDLELNVNVWNKMKWHIEI